MTGKVGRVREESIESPESSKSMKVTEVAGVSKADEVYGSGDTVMKRKETRGNEDSIRIIDGKGGR